MVVEADGDGDGGGSEVNNMYLLKDKYFNIYERNNETYL